MSLPTWLQHQPIKISTEPSSKPAAKRSREEAHSPTGKPTPTKVFANMTDFSQSPLLKPERIASDPEEAFRILPPCILSATFISPDDGLDTTKADRAAPDISPVFVVRFGPRHFTHKTLSPVGLAIACELVRVPGVSIATDTNGSGRYYERVTIAGHGEDLTSLSRLFKDAGPYEQVKQGHFKHDFRPDNLRAIPAAKIGKQARDIVMGHLRRIAREWEERGTMPHHFTASSYLENLERLFHLNDLEAAGQDPLASLPLIVGNGEAA